MTREEAINMFKSLIEGKSQLNACGIDSEYGFRCGERFFKALETAIKALEQEPCDCISRAEAIKALTKYRDDLGGLGLFHICEDSYIYEKRTATDCIEIIENLPSQPNCPNCGAKMESEDKE